MPGFEPELHPPKGRVLPLHHIPVIISNGARSTRAAATPYSVSLVYHGCALFSTPWYNLEMTSREFFARLNVVQECRKYGTPLSQCPQFLFVLMGIVIVVSLTFSFLLGRRYIDDPRVTVLVLSAVTGILLSITFIITRSFEQLAETGRLKTEFINIVSHQLRSPLSNLKWGLDFLMSEGAARNEEEAGYFQLLKENIGRMHELVNDLLTVARVEQGTFPFQEREFDFGDIVKEAVEGFRSLTRASNIEVVVEKEQVPLLRSDPSLVRHVLENLLDNAARYAWKGAENASALAQRRKNRIVVRYRSQENRLRAEVEDNGVGIPSEDQKYIFQKFFRSSNAVRRQTEGSGLGLFIAKSLLEKAGGEIGFQSEENKGSTFWFTLPYRTVS